MTAYCAISGSIAATPATSAGRAGRIRQRASVARLPPCLGLRGAAVRRLGRRQILDRTAGAGPRPERQQQRRRRWQGFERYRSRPTPLDHRFAVACRTIADHEPRDRGYGRVVLSEELFGHLALVALALVGEVEALALGEDAVADLEDLRVRVAALTRRFGTG